MAWLFNRPIATGSRAEDHVHAQNPTLTMTTTHIEWSFKKITRLADASDLAEMLFPSNRNQQHAFLALWTTLKWSDHHIVPNLTEAACGHGVSRRTLERLRAKLQRLGLIEHVSRFSDRAGYRDAWVLSSRFERSLQLLAEWIAGLRDPSTGSREKDLLLLELSAARKNIARHASDHQPEASASACRGET